MSSFPSPLMNRVDIREWQERQRARPIRESFTAESSEALQSNEPPTNSTTDYEMPLQPSNAAESDSTRPGQAKC